MNCQGALDVPLFHDHYCYIRSLVSITQNKYGGRVTIRHRSFRTAIVRGIKDFTRNKKTIEATKRCSKRILDCTSPSKIV